MEPCDTPYFAEEYIIIISTKGFWEIEQDTTNEFSIFQCFYIHPWEP